MHGISLESFEAPAERDDRLLLTPQDYAQACEDAFTRGLEAGRQEASALQASEAARTEAAIRQNLQDLSFTYHEARHSVLQALGPLISDFVETVLPHIARQGLGALVLDVLRDQAALATSGAVRVRAEERTLARLRDLLRDTAGLPLAFEQDPAAPPGTVTLKFPEAETRIDQSPPLAALQDAVASYFNLPTKETGHE